MSVDLKPIWRYKVRVVKTTTGIERVVKIPNQIADQIGDFVKITIEGGRVVLIPDDTEIKKINDSGGG